MNSESDGKKRVEPAREPGPQDNLADMIRRRVEPLGGFELELPPRGPLRDPPDFSDWDLTPFAPCT